MEKQYIVEMCITVNDNDLEKGQTIDELVLNSLEEAPFQVDTVIVREKVNMPRRGGSMQIKKLQ